MTVRKNTTNRRTLYKVCDTCGREFITTAETPWLRQMPKDGKKQKNCYFCSTKCFQASYKHIGSYDGKATERRKAKDANRDPCKRAETWNRYYAENGEKIRVRRREWYEENREKGLEDNRYYREKAKLTGSAAIAATRRKLARQVDRAYERIMRELELEL